MKKDKYIQFKEGIHPEGLERKGFAHDVELKSGEGEGDGILHIKFYALAFGNIDSWGDIIVPGAVDEWMKSEESGRMALCWQHDFQTVIGRITSKGVDDTGMWCEADILPTSVGKDAAVLLKGGAIREFSIGYRAEEYHYEKREGMDIRILDKIKIYEASPVTIAANAKAVLTDAKGVVIDNNNNQNQTSSIMTEQELKALKESLEAAKKSQAEMAQELKLYKDELAKATEMKAQIANLDKTVKDQQTTIEALQEKLDEANVPDTLKAYIGAFLNENKEAIEKKMAQEGGRIRLQTKAIVDITTALVTPNMSISLQKDTEISAARRKKNTFLDLLGVGQRTAEKLSWIEGSVQDDVDYVDENALNSHKGDATMGEVQRGYGKLQTSLVVSTEVADWFPMLLDWAQNEATAALLAKFNSEVWKGAGADTSATTKKKIYGIKTSSTAFAAIDKVKNPTIIDVIFNACEQVANAGYTPDVALVSPGVYFKLRSIKDENGNYILDRQNDILCSDNREVKVIKAYELTGDEIEVMDLSCCQPYAGNSFEFEAVRDADYDRWKFFFRLCGQNKIKSDQKKGLVYVASAATAITALTPAS